MTSTLVPDREDTRIANIVPEGAMQDIHPSVVKTDQGLVAALLDRRPMAYISTHKG
jgi:hypothetical protein